MSVCTCPDPDLCVRLGRHICGRLWDIWSGAATDIAEDVRAGYREMWERDAPVRHEPERSEGGSGVELARYFDRVVLVNLPRRVDRLDSCLKKLTPPAWPFLPPTIFAAVDGSRVPTPPGWTQGAGAWGCMQSHRQIIEQALLDGVNHLLVLEDDLVLRRGFRESVGSFVTSLPADADGLMLGGQHHAAPEPVCPGVVRCTNTQRTHAYSCRRAWMEELYRIWCSPHVTVHCDWVMGPAMRRFRVYAPDPFLIGQGRSKSDITCRDQPSKFWCPPSGSEPIIVLRASREVADSMRDHGWHRGYDLDKETGYDTGLCRVVRRELATAKWIGELMWEVVSEEDWVLCVWHPDVKTEAIRVSWSGPVVEITAACVGSALAQWRAWQSMHGKGSVAG